MSDDGLILIIGSGGEHYREYLLRGVSQRFPIWLIDTAEPTWQSAYIAGCSVVPWTDSLRLIPDSRRIINVAVELARSHRVIGVLTYDETIVMTAARVAERLGLTGLTTDGANRCRNKQLTRECLTKVGLPQPGFALVETLDEARAAARGIGYPVVLKPRGMGASIGVVRADGPAELDASYRIAEHASHQGAPAYEGGVLVEELLTGPEISIDGTVTAGEYKPFFLARKRTGLPPCFEETGHIVDAADPLLHDPELGKVLCEAHRALGLGTGVTHTEVLLTRSGPAIVEVNARFGGDLIPYLGMLATGIDPGTAAAELLTGGRPSLTQVTRDCVGVRFLYPPEDCRIQRVCAPDPGAVPGLVEARVIAGPGAELRLPPRAHLGRYAYLICSAPTVAECDARLDSAASLFTLSCEKLAS